MIRKYFLVILLLTSSLLPLHKASAALINYAGYTADTATSIITGDTLEWLRWDLTRGMSFDAALQQYSADGWRLANATEVYQLMVDFDVIHSYGTPEPFPAQRNFIAMFGYTDISDTSRPLDNVAPDGTILNYGYREGSTRAIARDGSGYESNVSVHWGLINLSLTETISRDEMVSYDHSPDKYFRDSVTGVALVRSHVSVNETNPLLLIMGALSMMVFVRKLKVKRFSR
jgi:hypothetical protein